MASHDQRHRRLQFPGVLFQEPGALPSKAVAVFAVGMGAAVLSGYLCIHYFLRYLQTRSLLPFVLYRMGSGVFLLLWLGFRAG